MGRKYQRQQSALLTVLQKVMEKRANFEDNTRNSEKNKINSGVE